MKHIEKRALATERQQFALNTLSNLTKRFSSDPDFNSLINTFLLSVSGQFAAGSAFACIFNLQYPERKPIFLGSGKFKDNQMLREVFEDDQFISLFPVGQEPIIIGELIGFKGKIGRLAQALNNIGVHVIIGLRHGDSPVGIIGMSEKVNGRPLGQSELELFAAMAVTIAPLIVNSFLFMEIKKMNDWHRDILDNVDQGVIVSDKDLKIKCLNSAGLDIMSAIFQREIMADDYIGGRLERLLPDDVFPGWIGSIKKFMVQGEDPGPEQVIAKTPSGERILETRKNATGLRADNNRDFIVTFQDITSKKEGEQRLLELEIYAEKGQLSSSIAHELNNYLTMIMGGLELIKIAFNDGKIERANTLLEKLKTQAEAMERFTGGLMDSHSLDARKSLTNLNTIVTDVLSFIRSQSKFKKCSFVVNLEKNLPNVNADADQIALVLMNLLNNSADAIAERGIQNGQIAVTTMAHGGIVYLSIADNGNGIPPEVKEKLFKTNFTTKKHGHGFGLIACAKILKQHWAEFHVESGVNQGTSITIEFRAA
jgi:signal transduction histidine kinase